MSVTDDNEGPNPIDLHVGRRMRLRREVLNLTQGELAKAIDVSFQQVQKYERGMNRISASRLWMVARALRVPVSYFFDELPTTGTGVPVLPAEDPMHRGENIELMITLNRVSPRQRDVLRALIASMAGGKA